jgi:hypothetical protein
MSVFSKLKAIADAIRAKTGKSAPLNLDQMAEGVNEVYEAGKSSGGGGYEEGKKAAYNEFWDAYQENGKRTHYSYAFAGFGWTVDNFKPKYNIVPEHATGMFTQFVKRIDLVSHLESIGITIDLSQVINADNVFYSSNFTRIGEVNFTSLNKISHAFSYCGSLVTIDKIIVTENLVFSNVFVNCKVLEEVCFEGVIGQNGLNLQFSTQLSKASITSIINALSTTTSGLTVTLSKTAVESAFGSTTSAEWTSLIGTRSNWTISLV